MTETSTRTPKDPWKNAVCRQDTYYKWAVEHRASMWDFLIHGEPDHTQRERLRRAQRLCWGCPLKQDCQNERTRLVKIVGRVSGVWGGTVYAEREIDHRNNDSDAESEAA